MLCLPGFFCGSVDHRCFPAVCERGDAGFFFEEPDEVVRVLKANHLADIYDLLVCREKQFLCFFDTDLIQVLYGCIFIIFCKFTAQTKLVDAVFQGKLVKGVGILISSGKAVVHISDIRRDVIGASLLDCADQIKLRKEIDELPRAHDAMDFPVDIISQDLFPCCKDIRIFVKPIDKISGIVYFLKVILENRGAHETDGIFPDIVLADQLVVPAAVDDCKGTFGKVISGIDSICVFIVEFSGAICRVYDAERMEICRFIGERRCDGNTFVTQFIRKRIAVIVVPAVRVLKIAGQGETVACLGRDQAAEKFRGK